jgi:DNA-binding transcriptional MerR regulator
MANGQLSLEELADQVGLTRRAVRFYVQRGLLPPPLGLGRGRHYDQHHLRVLRRIQELQSAGYSLDAIGKILGGQDVPAVMSDVEEQSPPLAASRRTELAAELWTRLRLAPGFELHFDAAGHPSAEQLVQIRRAVRRILEMDDGDAGKETQQ